MHGKVRPAILAVALIGTSSVPASGLQTGPLEPPVILNEREEIRLALSAAPPHVHRNATVLVLGREGYRLVREGTNGFTCLVERAEDPAVRAPQCLDAVATEYVLPVKLEEARLRVSGATAATIESRIAAGFADGRFRAPPRPAFNYMMSAGQYLGADAGQWNPHVMVYTPYLTNRELGGDPRRPEFPFVAFDEGRPLALTVIVTTAFVDPATVDPGR